MTAATLTPATRPGAADGGLAARRAVTRWAWRLFRREWRQQLLVLTLIVAAVAATLVGSAVATNTPPPANAGFGTAADLANFPGSAPGLANQLAELAHRFGRLDLIENETFHVPGSTQTYQLRAQDPHGPFGRPMLALLSGRFPTTADQVAVTPALAATLDLRVGQPWRQAGVTRQVVGLVENPQSLLSQFALVPPGQVAHPTEVTVLFDAPGVDPQSIGPNVETAGLVENQNPINPETIVLALTTVLMLLIGLVSVGGFTVLAQRRRRSLAMLEATGASDKYLRMVVWANGAIVGIVGAGCGFALGLVVWLAYRPHLQTSVHHVIGTFQLPWVVIGSAMPLAVLATFLAAARPAFTITRVPVVAALSGRPAAPAKLHRSAVPGLLAAAAAVPLLGWSATQSGGGAPLGLVLGLVALIIAVVLLSPLLLAGLARTVRRAPLPVRLSVRDLARYRARSGSALAAISLGILIAALICVVAAARYSDVLDYAGPNLAADQLLVQAANDAPVVIVKPGPGGRTVHHVAAPAPKRPDAAQLSAQARAIAAALGASQVVELDVTSATLQHAARGPQFNGAVYLASPALLAAFGIDPRTIEPTADILTMRPGLAGVRRLQLVYGSYFGSENPGGNPTSFPCPPSSCLANPTIQQVSALPSGTSAPNTVITEHAVQQLHLQPTVAGWLIQTPRPLTAAQINSARLAAAAAGLTVETKSDQPTSAEVINWATVFGMVLALGVLAISVGLIRSESANDLRTLTATGGTGYTRRSIAAATAGALALLGAVLGTAAAYLAAVAYFSNRSLNGGLGALAHPPAGNLLALLVGLPLIAGVAGWLLSGREPPAINRQPLV